MPPLTTQQTAPTNRIMRNATTIFLVCLLLLTTNAIAVEEGTTANITFALISKSSSNRWFDLVKEGCITRSRSLSLLPPSKNVTCFFVGPEKNDANAQVGIIDDMVSGKYGKIDGISISVINAATLTPAINRAIAAAIPVITYDSDAEESDRMAYVGTDNNAFGTELGKLLDQLAPGGGKYGVVATSAPNLVQRFDGVTKRLADDSKWTPVSGHICCDLGFEFTGCLAMR